MPPDIHQTKVFRINSTKLRLISMKPLKMTLYTFLFFLSLSSSALEYFEGEAPYIKTNPTLSKVLAIEDAFLKASYKTGGEFYSETQLQNQITYEERILLKSNQRISEISLNSCEESSSKMKCSISLKYLKKNVLKPKGEFLKPCDESSLNFQACYIIDEQKSHYANGVYLVKARLSLLVKNSGIIRFEESYSIYGLGETEDEAFSSLSKQAQLRAFHWSKNNFVLLESEKYLVTRIFSRSKYKKENLLKEGLFPMRVIEKNNQVYVFCRTILFN